MQQRRNLGLREIFPSSQRRGGRDINQILRSFLNGADGVARSASPIGRSLNIRPAIYFGRTDHPGAVAPPSSEASEEGVAKLPQSGFRLL